MMSAYIQKIKDFKTRLGYMAYLYIYTPLKVFHIRHKSRINVIFVITELGPWKTENLYLAMKNHPRFNPVLRVLSTRENPKAKDEVETYLQEKGYDYEYINADEPLQKNFRADIIFYQKPYDVVYTLKHRYIKNRNALFSYVSYGFHNIVSSFICNQPLHNVVWQYYFENESCANETAEIMDNAGRNICITGIPMTDALMQPKSAYKDLWKKQSVDKKRIIWAPHFSFASDSILGYSTFLEYYDFMLEMADKYKEKVQFVFKPHPLLQPHLYKHWGKEKTDDYYAEWASRENTQVELGQYIDIFMTSDAMIHDCSSFTQEYLYTHNPVMYLTKGENDTHDNNLNTFAKMAYHLHYKGVNKNQIEAFIQNVIEGQDAKRQERETFYKEWLTPPNGRAACQNIIDTILGSRDE